MFRGLSWIFGTARKYGSCWIGQVILIGWKCSATLTVKLNYAPNKTYKVLSATICYFDEKEFDENLMLFWRERIWCYFDEKEFDVILTRKNFDVILTRKNLMRIWRERIWWEFDVILTRKNFDVILTRKNFDVILTRKNLMKIWCYFDEKEFDEKGRRFFCF